MRHYEEVHAPLGMKYLTGLKGYARNYVLPTPGQPEPDFDCISEFWYEDTTAIEQVLDFLQTDEAKVLNDDHDSFMDSSRIVYFRVDERVSEL